MFASLAFVALLPGAAGSAVMPSQVSAEAAVALVAALSFTEVLDLAVARNLELAAARRGRAVREGEARAAGQYPNPELSLDVARDVPHEALSLGMPLDVFGRRSSRVALAREELGLAEVEEATALAKLRREVRLAFFGLRGADDAVTLAQTVVDVAGRVRQTAEARVSEGAAARLEQMQADLGLARARSDLALAQAARLAAQADLNALLNRPPAEPLVLAEGKADMPALPDLAKATSIALASNVELLAAEREARIEERRLGVLKAERWPVPVLSLGADFDAPGEFAAGGRAGLSFTVPLFSRNQGEIKGSLARIDQQRLRRESLHRGVEAKLVGALARASAERGRLGTYRLDLLPTAIAVERLAEESYRLGRTTLLAVLDAQRNLRDVKNESLQSLLAFQSAIADLEDVLGGPIP